MRRKSWWWIWIKTQLRGRLPTRQSACVLPVPELKRGFSSNGKKRTNRVVDLTTFSRPSRRSTRASPDAIAYEPKRGEIYVFNHRGNSATVIEAKSAKVVATIALGGSPNSRWQMRMRAVFTATSKIRTRPCDRYDEDEVAARWPLAPGEEPADWHRVDAAHHRLFAVCNNKMLVMLNNEIGKSYCDGADRLRAQMVVRSM